MAVGRWQAGGREVSSEKNPSGCLFPLPSQPLLLRLQLLLQADTNGALIATGNLSGGGSRACRRRWGPGGTPPSGPPTLSQPPSSQELLLSLLRASSFLSHLPPPLQKTPPSAPQVGLAFRTYPPGRGLLLFEIPLQFLERDFGKKGVTKQEECQASDPQTSSRGGKTGKRWQAVPVPKLSPSQTQTLPRAGRTVRGEQTGCLRAIGLLSGGGAHSLPLGPQLLEDLAGRGVHPSGGDHREGGESGTSPPSCPHQGWRGNIWFP